MSEIAPLVNLFNTVYAEQFIQEFTDGKVRLKAADAARARTRQIGISGEIVESTERFAANTLRAMKNKAEEN